jgi:hypothetical protein
MSIDPAGEAARGELRTKVLAALVAALTILGYYALPDPDLRGSAEPPAPPTVLVSHAVDTGPRTD